MWKAIRLENDGKRMKRTERVERMEQRSLFDAPIESDFGDEARREQAAAFSEADAVPRSLFPEDCVVVAVPEKSSGGTREPANQEPGVAEASKGSRWESVHDLGELRALVTACRECPLREGAKGVVFGEGDPRARVMFVGEGPGQTEDETGRPFVGRAGQLLDLMLRVAGFERKQVFIANIVKCRPPGNRLPLPHEVEACLPNLEAQIRIIDPRIIVLLGALSSQTLLDPGIRVTRDRGKWFEKDGRSYLVTFHPAAVLRDEAGKKRLLLEDFKSLQAKWEQVKRESPKGSERLG